MESGEIKFEKVSVSPRPPPTISFKDNWMKELDSEIAGSSKDTQRIWLDRTKVHSDGRTGKTKPHVPSLYKGIQKIPRTMVSHLE